LFDPVNIWSVAMSVVYLVHTLVEPDHEREWRRWQDQEHIPALLALPGYVGVQRLVSIDEARSYLNVWWLQTSGAFGTPAYLQASLTPWFDRIRPFYSVRVEFAVTDDGFARTDAGSWDDRFAHVMLDRETRPGPISIHAETIASNPSVARVVLLHPLQDGSAQAERSLPSSASLIYLRELATASPRPAEGVERTRYRLLSNHLAEP
jgi:hypothetical protein